MIVNELKFKGSFKDKYLYEIHTDKVGMYFSDSKLDWGVGSDITYKETTSEKGIYFNKVVCITPAGTAPTEVEAKKFTPRSNKELADAIYFLGACLLAKGCSTPKGELQEYIKIIKQTLSA